MRLGWYITLETPLKSRVGFPAGQVLSRWVVRSIIISEFSARW